ncbi:MAG TPA: DUF2345 domain-containing protein, partial [Burkholderiaceae bacterium]|nr:DUF2345 domain-containing protein [Burkholderiaceae bacterium]
NINVLAKLDIKLSANTISIMAKEQLELGGGGSYSVYTSAGITHKTPGTWVEHASVHSLQGPDNKPVSLSTLTSELCLPRRSLVVALHSHAVDGWPMADEPYTLYRDGAQIETGITDAAGQVHIDKHDFGKVKRYRVVLHQGQIFDLPVHETLPSDEGNAKRSSSQGHREAGENP